MSPSSAQKEREAVERPLRYIKDGQFRKLDAVKNLAAFIREQSVRASQKHPSEKPFFDALRALFEGYEKLTPEERVSKIEQALALIGGVKEERAFEGFMAIDHPLRPLQEIEKKYAELAQKVQFLKGVGPKMAEKFRKAGIETIYDLMNFFPHRYEDRREVRKIKDAREGEDAVFVGEIIYHGMAFYKGLRRKTYEVQIQDETGRMKLKWFRFFAGSFEHLRQGMKVIVVGKPKFYKGQCEIHHPDFEAYQGELDSQSFGRIIPVYTEIGGVYQKTIRKVMDRAVSQFCADRVCLLPAEICERHEFLPPWKILHELHRPVRMHTKGECEKALSALAFEELFFYCLSLAKQKQTWNARPGIAFDSPGKLRESLVAALPYKLTGAQTRTLATILEDMKKPFVMNRLLQGDVGSGKTVVAALACLQAIESGFQAALMAPTELLAEQHARNFRRWFEPLGLRVVLASGNMNATERDAVYAGLASGEIAFVVGTHAVLEPKVEFSKLGLVVIDEQHRFGVRQRAKLRAKGPDPDVLVMSATPIPRTLALTLFSDLNVSILDEFPLGQKRIETHLFFDRDRARAYEEIRARVAAGEQAFVVYPLVEASERLEAKDATSMAEIFQREVFSEFKVALIHGQMPPAQKDEVMGRFLAKEIDILVSTTVIEVGIDVPNATCILIEHPDRFGLSQLHQLRGRVGRGEKESVCLLIAPTGLSQLARARLKIFAQTLDGFALAEEDLRIRGPGDLFGVLQSGLPPFRIAAFPKDLGLLESARIEAFRILESDPGFQAPAHRHFSWVLSTLWKDKMKMTEIG